MATTTRYPIRIPLRLPRPIEPTESPASKPNRPQTPNLPPTLHTSAPCFRSKQRQPTRSNLHSLNSWPAVQCNEGFCNAPQSQCFTLTRPRRRRNLTIPRIKLTSAAPRLDASLDGKMNAGPRSCKNALVRGRFCLCCGRQGLGGHPPDGFLSLFHGPGYVGHQLFQIVLDGLKLRRLSVHFHLPNRRPPLGKRACPQYSGPK